MPMYDFKCRNCSGVHERLVWSSDILVVPCPICTSPVFDGLTDVVSLPSMADRQLCVPAAIRMGDGQAARKAQRICEPTWVYPDGHRESLNSANTRPEE